MAKTPYIPYDEDLDTLFQTLGIEIRLAQFGNAEGWLQADYMSARARAMEMLNSDDDWFYNENYDKWMDLLTANPTLNYWSTEYHYIG